MVTGEVSRAKPWLVATVRAVRRETPTASTLVLAVDEWPGHHAGQHIDVKLTAEDGYSAQRSYSIASAPRPSEPGADIEVTVQNVADGEVSPYLTGHLEVGDQFEIRGPIGRWFVWRPPLPEETPSPPILLVGGGSGIVPLRAMVGASAGSRVPFRVLYSVREPAEIYYEDEWSAPPAGVDVTTLFTRRSPAGSSRPMGRITLADLDAHGWPTEFEPRCYICGPTSFVDAVADMLVTRGHSASNIRTERFGPS